VKTYAHSVPTRRSEHSEPPPFLWLGLCHAVIAMPIVLLILPAALHAIDPNLERAALGLGGSREAQRPMSRRRRPTCPIGKPKS